MFELRFSFMTVRFDVDFRRLKVPQNMHACITPRIIVHIIITIITIIIIVIILIIITALNKYENYVFPP